MGKIVLRCAAPWGRGVKKRSKKGVRVIFMLGMIGEEVGEVVPEVVSYEPDGKYVIGMDYSRLTSLLVEAIKE